MDELIDRRGKTHVIDDTDKSERRRVYIDVGDLASQNDGLRTRHRQVESVNHRSRLSRHLQATNFVSMITASQSDPSHLQQPTFQLQK